MKPQKNSLYSFSKSKQTPEESLISWSSLDLDYHMEGGHCSQAFRAWPGSSPCGHLHWPWLLQARIIREFTSVFLWSSSYVFFAFFSIWKGWNYAMDWFMGKKAQVLLLRTGCPLCALLIQKLAEQALLWRWGLQPCFLVSYDWVNQHLIKQSHEGQSKMLFRHWSLWIFGE